MAGFYARLPSDARAMARERVKEIEFKIELNGKNATVPDEELEPKTKRLKMAKDSESFDDLIRDLDWNQFEADSEPLRTLLSDYRRYVREQAAICIQQSFRKYLLLKNTSTRRQKRRGEATEKCRQSSEDRCSAEHRSENCADDSKEHMMEHRMEHTKECPKDSLACDDEPCKVNCARGSSSALGDRICSDEYDPSCDANCNARCNRNCNRNCNTNCNTNCDHCLIAQGSSTNNPDEVADNSKESPTDSVQSSNSPHAGRPTEGSFKSKKNELLNCSMDVDMCATKDEHPFESFEPDEPDEIKGKRCSTASLSCKQQKLSPKR